MRISDWSSDVCSSDLGRWHSLRSGRHRCYGLRQQSLSEHQRPELDGARWRLHHAADRRSRRDAAGPAGIPANGSDFHRHVDGKRSEEHTSELQSLMRISYAVFCLKKTIQKTSSYSIITTITSITNIANSMYLLPVII